MHDIDVRHKHIKDSNRSRIEVNLREDEWTCVGACPTTNALSWVDALWQIKPCLLELCDGDIEEMERRLAILFGNREEL